MRRLACAALLGYLSFLSMPSSAQTENRPWMLLVCQPSDGGPDLTGALWTMNNIWVWPESDTAWPGRSYTSIYSYWADVSLDHINPAGTRIADKIYTLPYTTAQMQQITTSYAAQRKHARNRFFDDCVAQAKDDINFFPFYGIVAMINVNAPGIDDTGMGVRTLTPGGNTPGTKNYGALTLNRDKWNNLTVIAHETGHAHGFFNHSFDDFRLIDSAGNFGSCPGEYGDAYDIMSAAAVWGFPTTLGANAFWSGPGLNAALLLMQNWLNPADIHRFNSAIDSGTAIKIAALEDYRRTKGLPYVVQIPVDADPQHYLTVELRQDVGWDQQLKKQPAGTARPDPLGSAILVHEVTKQGFHPEPIQCSSQGYRSYLRTDGSGNAPLYRRDVRTFKDSVNNKPVTIAVNRIGCGTADITINPYVTINPPLPQPPFAAPTGFTATPLCGGAIDLHAAGNSPNPADCTGMVPYVVFQRADPSGAWLDLTYSGLGPGMQDAPPGDVAIYRACNRNADGDTCTAPLVVGVSHAACIPGGGPPKCGGPGGPICPTTHGIH